MKHITLFAFLMAVCCIASTQTKVILLGTGTPNPDPGHSGGSIAIVVNNTPYVIDFGPGLVRQAASLSPRYGGEIEALSSKNLKTAFLTHLHSDHTVGFPDFLLTPWVMGRDKAVELYGPEGTKNLADNILKAYDADIKYRLYGLEPANNQGWRVNTHEFSQDGEIYKDSLIKVEAFKVVHGSWPNAYGFRFTTPHKTIVISGDTRPCENILKYAQNADILIHEVYSHKGWEQKDDFWKKYHKANHTSTFELGKLANKAKPGKLILYHLLFWGSSEQDLLDEIAQFYQGKVIVGKDLMIID